MLALTFFGVGLFSHVLLEIASRGSYALHDTRTPLLFAAGGTAAHAAFSDLLLPVGIGGLALAMSLSTALEASGLLFAVSRRAGFDWRPLAVSVSKTLIATAAMAPPVAWLMSGFMLGPDLVGLLTVLVAAGALGAAVFVGVCGLLRSADLAELLPLVLPRRRGLR
jgi:peptidoglycan biosynthesis protein MviN/MurJ (putative lipid II flippase)